MVTSHVSDRVILVLINLISVNHINFCAFGTNPSLELQGVFIDLSKEFDKFWDVGLLYLT